MGKKSDQTVDWNQGAIKRLPPSPPGTRTTFHHPERHRLVVIVGSKPKDPKRAASKTFFYVARVRGRQQRLLIGSFPSWTPKAAVDRADELQRMIDRGEDPQQERRDRNAAPTFADLAAAYIERYAKRRKRSWKTDQAYIDRFLLPTLGEVKAAEVSRRQVIGLIEDIAEETPVQARRVFALLRTLYNWAIGVDLVETSPCDRVKAPGREQPRDRVLTDAELLQVWTALDNVRQLGESRSKNDLPMSEGTALALRLALVTGQRIGEVTGMTWFEVDRETAWWTIPATRSKNGLEHRVPLSRIALLILTRAAAISDGSGHVFPGRNDAKPIDHGVIGYALRRAREQSGFPHFTAHDLRRTAATRMASAGVSRVVVGKILNHVERGVTAIYDRAGYDAEKREALDVWAAELLRLVRAQSAVKA